VKFIMARSSGHKFAIIATLLAVLAGSFLLLVVIEGRLAATNKLSVPETRVAPDISLEADPLPKSTTRYTPGLGSEKGEPRKSQAGIITTEIVIPDDELTWDRENAYTWKDSGIRQHDRPQPYGNHVNSPEDTDPEARRILVVGDSFVAGFGLYDLDRVWHRQMATMLSEKYGKGRYQVMATGGLGTSALSYAEFLSPAVLEEVDPDIILIGFLPNDWVPDGSEYRICGEKANSRVAERTCKIGDWYTHPEYIRCIEGHSGMVGRLLTLTMRTRFPHIYTNLIDRLCHPSRFTAVEADFDARRYSGNPGGSPYWALFEESAQRIVENAAGTPVLVLVTPYADITRIHPQVSNALIKSGMQVITPSRSATVLADHPESGGRSLWVNPSDSHPDSMLHQSYAEDAFNYLVKQYPLNTNRTQRDYQMLLVSNFTPSTMSYEGDGVQATITYAGTSDFIQRATTKTDFRLRPTPPQSVPCAPFGRPHARVVFNRQQISTGLAVRISMSATQPMVIAPVTYNTDGEERFGRPQVLQPGGSLTLEVDQRTTGFVIGSVEGGCPIDQPLNLTPFSLSIQATKADNR
jgi:hypothetical protein